MHETAGAEYKQAVRDTFVWCAGEYGHWRRLECLGADGSRLSKEKVAEQLYAELGPEFVNRKPK